MEEKSWEETNKDTGERVMIERGRCIVEIADKKIIMRDAMGERDGM